MTQAHGSRRTVLKGFLGAVALLATNGRHVLAEIKTDYNFRDKAYFKETCETTENDGNKGTFIDSPQDKLTICVWGDGAKTTCDENGKNCTWNPPPKQSSSSGWPWADIVSGDLPTLVEDPGPAAPPDEPRNATPDARAKGGKRRKRGRRKK